MATSLEKELLQLTSNLLATIAAKDWKSYAAMCDASLTCFEPEALGQLVEGLEFHKYYFDLEGAPSNSNTTLASSHVRKLGDDAAVVSYVRLVQKLVNGSPVTVAFEETRVWQRIKGQWKHVHFHRSPPAR
jgi:calcium/calmodulin-dependent protein kinase (CaM kinase) II